MMKYFLKNGADINKVDKAKNTALHVAVMQLNDTEPIEILLSSGANVNAKNKNSQSPIHNASYLGKANILDLLLKQKDANILLQDSQGNTPLHLSIMKREMEITKVLLKNMKENTRKTVLITHNGTTPLHVASYVGDLDTCQLLLSETRCEVNTVDNRGMSALHYASLSNSVECVKFLLQHNANPKLNSLSENTPIDLTENQQIKTLLSEAKVEDNSIEETENISIDEKNEVVPVQEIDPVDKYGFSGRHPYVQTQRDLEYNKEEGKIIFLNFVFLVFFLFI